MSVSSSTSRVQYNCNGITTAFPVTFGVKASSELQVILADPLGVPTVLTETTDYTVTAVNNEYESGSTVTTVATYDSGYTITIIRDVPLTQESDFTEGMPTLYESFEDGLDKLTRIVQQLQEKLDRMIVVPVTESDLLSRELPSAAARAGKYLGFDDDGEPVAAVDIEGVTVSTFGNSLLTADDADEARTAMEVYSEDEVDAALTAYVPKSLYDANTILAANTDNTPTAVTVAEDRIVGRKAGGNIGALTGAEVQEILNISSGGGITQTVLSSVLSSGLPNFITDPNDGLKVAIDGTPTPVVISFANGFDASGPLVEIGAIETDTEITGLTDNSTNFLYAERDSGTGAITLGKTTNAPSYAPSVPTSTEGADADGSTETSIGYNATQHFAAQSFILAGGGTVSKISFRVKKLGSPTGNLVMEIQTDNAGVPSNTAVTNGTSALVAESGLSGSYTMTDFTFATPPILTAGVTYHAVIKFQDRSASTSNYSGVARSGSSYYANGHASYSDNTATPVWTSFGTGDIDFWVYYSPLFFFSTSEMKMYDYSTGSAVAKQLVFLGEAVTSGGQVTSVVNYALRGEYDTGDITTTATSTAKSHNIGVDFVIATLLEGAAGARTQIMSKDFTSITRNSITWSAAATTSRLLVKRGF